MRSARVRHTSRAGATLTLLAGALLAGPSCSSATPAPSAPVARFTLATDAPPPFLDVPFPTDAYLANGKIVDPLPGIERTFQSNASYLTHELAKLNGFSRHAM